jgi:hypothetical protein
MRQRLSRQKAYGSAAAAAAAPGGLQHLAGNKAMAGLVKAARKRIEPRDFDALMSTQSKVKSTFGVSSFGRIRDALASLRKAASPDKRWKYLEELDDLCTKFLNSHSGTDPTSLARRALVEQLVEEIEQERHAFSRQLAQGRYMQDVKSAGSGEGTALKVLTGGGMAASTMGKKDSATASEMGLTPAEAAAIRIFTADDYKYINPTTANNAGWLKSQKSANAYMGAHADKTLIEEGTLHTGVAMHGLLKLPSYDKDVFRGASFSEEDFTAQWQQGKELTFNSFASASQERRTAENFAKTTGKPFAVVAVIKDSGGRDVSSISMVKGEKEVVLLPGSTYVVRSLKKITAPDGSKQEWYEAELVPRKKR